MKTAVVSKEAGAPLGKSKVKSQKVQNLCSILILEITQSRRKAAKLEIFNLLILTMRYLLLNLDF
ncbi:MAG: hypothetical protein ACKOPK_20025 [Dolichospermum sp.]